MMVELGVLLAAGEDRGQALGTLFEIVDETGLAIAGAGFPWTFSSRVMGQTRRLEVWVRSDSQPRFVASRVEHGTYRPALSVRHDRVIPLEGGYRGGRDLNLGGSVLSLQQIGERTLSFVNRGDTHGARVKCDDEVVLEVGFDVASGICHDGRLILSETGAGALHVYEWPGHGEATYVKTHTFSGGGAYCFAPFNARLFFGDDRGKVWSLGEDGVRNEFDRNIGEFYSAALWGDEIIFGYYPLPRLYAFNGRSWRTIAYLPADELAVKSSGVPIPYEAQALAIAAGRLWAGVYPFGEVAVSDVANLGRWQRQRLFTRPQRGQEPYPYAFAVVDHHYGADSQTARQYRAGGKIEIANGDWAQRVQSFARCNDAVYAATGNMRGQCFQPQTDTFVERPEEYGQIYGAKTPGAVSVSMPWPADGILKARIKATSDRMMLDVGDTKVDLPCTTVVQAAIVAGRIVAGGGLFGTSCAHNIQLRERLIEGC